MGWMGWQWAGRFRCKMAEVLHGQGLRRRGPRPNSGKDTRCTPAYRELTANRCCPLVREGDGAQSGIPTTSWKGHAPHVRYLHSMGRTARLVPKEVNISHHFSGKRPLTKNITDFIDELSRPFMW